MSMVAAAWDTHVHVIGDADRFPMVADRHYTPGPASVAQLEAHLARQGLGRAVIVQPSVYGFDNRCLLDALDQMQGRARGVAVPAPEVDLATLQAWHARGVRGVRINLESSGDAQAQVLAQALTHWAARLPARWHLQVYAPLQVVAQALALTGPLGLPLVLDHCALWHDAASASPAARQVTEWLARGELHIKLSASYRVPLPAGELQALVQSWLALRPDRLLWASDWPHTQREPGHERLQVSAYRSIAPQALQAERARWLPSAELQRLVLVDNPQRLYD